MNRYLKFLLIVIPVVVIDLLTKSIFKYREIPIINNLFHISYSENPGLVFGLFSHNLFFTILTPLLVIGLIIYYFYNKELTLVGSALIVSGLLGNLIDRIIHGYVIDWIFVMIYPKYNISLFNLADTSLVIGVLVSIYFLVKKN